MEPVNPYQAPAAENERSRRQSSRPKAWLTIAFGLGGALIGYVVLVVLANLEDRPFYSLRRLVTGEDAMSRIVVHPANWWLDIVLASFFLLGGATIGFWYARRQSRRK